MSPEEKIVALVEDRLAKRQCATPLVLGLCGAQGSGKSTIAASLAKRFRRSAILSLDDIYLTRGQRQQLAKDVHPLLATRGVPGTHDVALGVETIAAVMAGKPARLPRFDKAIDDRTSSRFWPAAPQDCELLIFEGWCVGAVAQRDDELVRPVNALEAQEDTDGTWRRYVNAMLATRYRSLFEPIGALALLLAPDWPQILTWRTEQEEELRRRNENGVGLMNSQQLSRFVSHYERLSRHIMREMPSRSDICLKLNANRSLLVNGLD